MLKVPLLLVDSFVVVVVLHWLRTVRRRRGAQRPPGPAGYPLVGNVLDLMVSEMWKRAWELGKTYGDLVYLQSFGQRIVITNSYETAVDLLEGRSLNYSDRPNSVMVNDLQRWNWMFANLSYGEVWRTKRAPLQRFFEQSNIIHYEDVLNNESRKLLCSFLRSPKDYDAHIRAAMASLIMMITYGHEVVSADDPYVSLAKEGTEQLALALRPGAFLVDIVPWLKYIPQWFPGADFQAVAACGRKLSHDMRYLPFFDAKDKISAGTAKQSFISEQIEAGMGEDGKLLEEDEEIISATTGLCYIAGADTTVSSLMSFMSAMTLFPEVQRHAQEEIDNVVGDDRLPVLSDRPHLPYCDAVYKEVLRWHPAIPLGVPHAAKDDDIFAGYLIPAKTTIIANQWAMLQDPDEYPDPEAFMPERFMPKVGERVPRDPSKIAFGFGRRICPGKYLAENTIFIMTVRTLAAFNISKETDANGRVIEPNIQLGLDGVISRTHRFDCTIVPRSKKAEELILLE